MKRSVCRISLAVILVVYCSCIRWDWSRDDIVLQEEVSPWGGLKAIVLLKDPGPLDSFYTSVEVEILGGPRAGKRILIFKIAGKSELFTKWVNSGELKIIGDFSNEITHKTTIFARQEVLYESLSGTGAVEE